jgi:hypothetical protein
MTLHDRVTERDHLRRLRALFDAAMEKTPQERNPRVVVQAGSDTALRDGGMGTVYRAARADDALAPCRIASR